MRNSKSVASSHALQAQHRCGGGRGGGGGEGGGKGGG